MRLLTIVGATLLLAACAAVPPSAELPIRIDGVGPDGRGIDYLAVMPKGVDRPEQGWPLLVFLHGRGEVGGELAQVSIHGPIKAARGMTQFPFLVVAPHLMVNDYWKPEWVIATVDDALMRWPIDADRIYLTGLSLGAYGTWDTAVRYPGRFAAIAPISGGGRPERACAIVDVPTWSFHGVLDTVVAAADNQATVDALRACGGAPGLTLYPHLGHDAWTETYASSQLYAWLLSHELDNNDNER